MIQLYSTDLQKNSLYKRENELEEFLKLSSQPGIRLLTCNRSEFYSGEGDVPEEIVRHLFRVISGIESNLIGEIAILGQVKEAYFQALSQYKLSKGLHVLFQTAFYVGKKVRNKSAISKGAMSHSQAAVELICASGINLDKALITIIGAHKLNEDIIKFLISKGAETIFLGNKSFEKAQVIAQKFGCETFRLDEIKEFLQFTDILISATSAPHEIVHLNDFPANKKMLVIDLAFPHDIDKEIGNLDEVTLYNLENIENKVNQNIENRKDEILKAETIIDLEVKKFMLKYKHYGKSKTIPQGHYAQ